MTVSPKTYSSFPALLIFFIAAIVMDLDQSVTLHRQKLETMKTYDETARLQRQFEEKSKWVKSMREDLLRLAPGHPEASQIVAELNLQPMATAASGARGK